MSVTIVCRPVSEGIIINGGTSSTEKALNETFGKFPIMLSDDDLPVLTGMAAVYRGEPNPFTQLIDAIDKYERIQVIVKY